MSQLPEPSQNRVERYFLSSPVDESAFVRALLYFHQELRPLLAAWYRRTFRSLERSERVVEFLAHVEERLVQRLRRDVDLHENLTTWGQPTPPLFGDCVRSWLRLRTRPRILTRSRLLLSLNEDVKQRVESTTAVEGFRILLVLYSQNVRGASSVNRILQKVGDFADYASTKGIRTGRLGFLALKHEASDETRGPCPKPLAFREASEWRSYCWTVGRSVAMDALRRNFKEQKLRAATSNDLLGQEGV